MRTYEKRVVERSYQDKGWEAPWNGPIEVVPRENEDPEKMIKRFTRKVKDSGILKEFVIASTFRTKRELAAIKKRARSSQH